MHYQEKKPDITKKNEIRLLFVEFLLSKPIPPDFDETRAKITYQIILRIIFCRMFFSTFFSKFLSKKCFFLKSSETHPKKISSKSEQTLFFIETFCRKISQVPEAYMKIQNEKVHVLFLIPM